MAGTDVGGAEDREAGNVEAFAAVQVGFVALAAAEEADVRIDEQQGVAGGGAARADGPHVGAFVGIGGPSTGPAPASAGKARSRSAAVIPVPAGPRCSSARMNQGSQWVSRRGCFGMLLEVWLTPAAKASQSARSLASACA